MNWGKLQKDNILSAQHFVNSCWLKKETVTDSAIGHMRFGVIVASALRWNEDFIQKVEKEVEK